MNKPENFRITKEIKDAIVDHFVSLGYTKYAMQADELIIDNEITILDYTQLFKVLTWHTVPEILKPIKKIITNWERYMIHINHTRPGKQQSRLIDILFKSCEQKIKWNYCYWFIPTRDECEKLIEYLGQLIAVEPDLPCQFYIARKEAFRILKRLIREEQ